LLVAVRVVDAPGVTLTLLADRATVNGPVADAAAVVPVPEHIPAVLDCLAAVDAQAAVPVGSDAVSRESTFVAVPPHAANETDVLDFVEGQAVAPGGSDSVPASPGTAVAVDGLPVPSAPAGTGFAADTDSASVSVTTAPRWRTDRRRMN